MTTGKLRLRHPLNNGLTLEVWDLSRPVAGDRWQVVLEARITVPVSPAEVAAALGEQLVYSRRDARNFIDARQVAAVLQEMENRLLELAPGYLGHPDFAQGFIAKEFAAYQEKRRYHRD
jgi:hypothetical protein